MIKKRYIFLLMIICLFTISAVSAADNNTRDIISMEKITNEYVTIENNANIDYLGSNENYTVLKENPKTFSDLNELINGNNASEVHLYSNYTYNSTFDNDFKSGITINHNITIYGNNFSISGDEVAVLFKPTNGNIIFKDINFIYATKGIIGNCTVINSNFSNISSYSLEKGSAINCNFIGDEAINQGYALNCTFVGNSKNYYYVLIESSAENCIFKNNKGGAMYKGNALNCTFISNSADNGGAIYSVSATNCTFINNKAKYHGGAIYRGNALNCTFINNHANYGGAMAGNGYLATKCTFIKNTATEYGGAVYLNTVKNCEFINNSANYAGGAIYESTITNSTFEYNNAANGGAVCEGIVNNCTFNYNSAREHGGAVINATVSKNSRFINNSPEDTYNVIFFELGNAKTFTDLNNTINGNENNEIYLDDNYTFDLLSDNEFKDGIIIDRPLTIYGNEYTLNGFNQARIFKITSENVTFQNIVFTQGKTLEAGGAINGYSTAINCTFTKNTAPTAGAMYNGNALNCTFIENTGTYFGGAGFDAFFENCIFINNTCLTGGALSQSPAVNCTFINNHAISGGAMDRQYAINCTFISNTAETGGAMCDSSTTKGSVAINSIFIGNSAKGENADGGAMSYVDALSCTFIGNWANRDGGAMIFSSASNSIFKDNFANRFGGAMYGEEYIVFNSTFANNSAISGGAIYQVDAVDCTFANNTATSFGGAAFESVVINSTFEYNKANKGGAVNGIRVSNCTFNYNSATEYGGAVNDAKVSMNSKFDKNTAKTGNDTYNIEFFNVGIAKSFSDLDMLINGNNETDIYLDCNYTFNPYLDIDYNLKSNHKYGIVINRPLTIHGNGFTLDGFDMARIFKVTNNYEAVLKDMIFVNGHADDNNSYNMKSGGAISGDCTAINCSFIDNSARDHGGATIRVDAINCTFINNYAKNGGGAYAGVLIINCTFINNTAVSASAVYGISRFYNYTLVENCTIINTQSNNRNALVDVNEKNCTFINNEDLAPKYIFTVSNFSSTYGVEDKLIFNFTTFEGDPIIDATIQADIYDEENMLVNRYYFLSSKDCIIDLDAGNYHAVLTVLDYILDPVNTTIIVAKAPTNISLDVGNLIVGQPIIVNVTANVTSDVSLWVGSTHKNVYVSANKPVSVNMGIQNNPGMHWIIAEVYGLNYIESRDSQYVKIYDKINEDNLFIPEINYGEEIITVNNFPSDALGNVTLTINAVDYIGTVSEGTANVKVHKLDAGNYTYILTYSGDDKYISSNVRGNLSVNKIGCEINISDIEFDWNSSGSSDVLLIGATDINANVINHPEAIINVKDNVITVSGLDVGTYILNVTAIADSNHNPITKTANITINKINPIMTFNNVNTAYKSGEQLVVTLRDGDNKAISGAQVKIQLGNIMKTLTTDDKGQVSLTTNGLTPNNYVATIIFDGDNHYNKSNSTANVTINKANTIISASDVSLTYKETNGELIATIISEHGKSLVVNLNIEFNGKTYAVKTDSEGMASIPIDTLKPGTYTATITYKGSNNYKASTATTKVTVTKAATSISASDVSLSYKEPNGELVATITNEHAKPLVVNLNINLNGKTYTARTDSEGKANIEVGTLTPGTYTATITYKGSNNYKASTTTAKVTVTKANTNITAQDVSLAYKDSNGELVSSIISEHGKALVVTLNIELNGKTYNVKTDSNGQASIPVDTLKPGTYTATITYKGSSNYKASTTTTKVTVTKAATSISTPDVSFAYKDSNGELVATIVSEHGKPLVVNLNVDLNGKTYTVKTDFDGKASIPIDTLKPGTYTATISYKGSSNYKASSTTAKVTVTKAATSISSSDVSIAYKDPNGELVTTIISEHGKPLVVTLNIELNGKTYNVKTDSNGQASIPIDTLTPGTYTATITYKGSNNYKASTTTAKITVTKSGTIISAPDVSVAHNDPNGKLVSTITNEHGKPLVVNLNVNLNGKTYTAKTDSNGQAYVSTADLAPGTYTTTITYKGSSNYKASSTTAKIQVKK